MMDFVRWFKDIGIEDVPDGDGKIAPLGEMYRELTLEGLRVPHGFAVTATAYRCFLKETGLAQRIPELLADLDVPSIANSQEHGHAVRHAILAAELPGDLQEAIKKPP